MTHPFLRHASVLWMNSGSSLSTNLQRRARNLKRPTSSRTSTQASRTLTSGSLRWETAFIEVCKNSDEAMSSRSDGLLFARWKLFLPLRIMARIWPQLTTCWRNTSSWRLTFLPMRYASHYYKWLHIRVSCNAVNTQYLISVHYSSQNTHLGSWSTSWLVTKRVGSKPWKYIHISRVTVRPPDLLSAPCRIVWKIWTAKLTVWWPATHLTHHRWRTSVMPSMAASRRSRAWQPVAALNSTSPTVCINSSGTWMMKSLGSSKRVQSSAKELCWRWDEMITSFLLLGYGKTHLT